MKRIIAILTCLSTVSGFAQEAIPATGGEATGSGGTVSYTVGQVAYTTKTDGSTTTTEGVQQTYVISDDPSGIIDSKIQLEMVTFPNPTLDKIQLQIADLKDQKLTYTLTDVQGKLLQSKQVVAETTELDLNSYESGTYFLRVNNSKEEIRTFKIIKN